MLHRMIFCQYNNVIQNRVVDYKYTHRKFFSKIQRIRVFVKQIQRVKQLEERTFLNKVALSLLGTYIPYDVFIDSLLEKIEKIKINLQLEYMHKPKPANENYEDSQTSLHFHEIV